MSRNDHPLWIAGAISIAAAMLSAVGMTILVIARMCPPVASRFDPAGDAGPAQEVTREFLLGMMMSALTVYCIAQVIARRFFFFEWAYSRKVSSGTLGVFSIAIVLLAVVIVWHEVNTLESIPRGAGLSITNSSSFPSAGSMLTLAAMSLANLANLFFMYWWQATPRGQSLLRPSLLTAGR